MDIEKEVIERLLEKGFWVTRRDGVLTARNTKGVQYELTVKKTVRLMRIFDTGDNKILAIKWMRDIEGKEGLSLLKCKQFFDRLGYREWQNGVLEFIPSEPYIDYAIAETEKAEEYLLKFRTLCGGDATLLD